MSTPEVINALRLIALQGADENSPDAWYKSKCRWYSREFHTPLEEVFNLPIEKVLTTFFEDLYWSLAHGNDQSRMDFNQLVVDALKSESTSYQEEMTQIEAEDDEWYEQELAALHAQTETKAKAKAKPPVITQQMPKADQNGILIDKPNLANTAETITVNPVDPPVFGDDED
jgi:hypothetical protein